jgi:hypothetical protein
MPESSDDVALVYAEKRAERRALVEWGGEGGVQIANLDQAVTFAQTLIDQGAAPKGATAGGIIASVQHGAEIRTPARPNGIGPMQSIQLIPSINGRPYIMGDLAKALIVESDVLEPGTMLEEWMTGEPLQPEWTAHCKSHRKGDPKPVEHTFSWADAKRAGLSGKSGPWKDYPQRQMRYRALGFHARDQYGGLMLGLHTYEEGLDMPQVPLRELPPAGEPDPLFNGLLEAPGETESPSATRDEVLDAEYSVDAEGDMGDPTQPCDQDPSCALGLGHSGSCEVAA